MGPGFESQRNHSKKVTHLGGFFLLQINCHKLFTHMPYLYILYSEKLNKYYVGACTDLGRRLYEHNIGHSKFTSLGVPWTLVYQEELGTLLEARQRESYIKQMKSRKYIEGLIS